MKQLAFWILFAAAVCALGLWPTRAVDASALLPAQLLVIDAKQGNVTVSADCGATGSGASVGKALENLRRQAPGELFLDTAGFVVLTDSAWYLLPQVAASAELRPAARLVRATGEVDAAKALAYLQAHTPELTLESAFAALLRSQTVKAPLLLATEGGVAFGA